MILRPPAMAISIPGRGGRGHSRAAVFLALALGAVMAAGSAATVAQEAPGSTDLELLDAGAEPRQTLRYTWTEGTTVTTRIEQHITATTAAGRRQLMELDIPGTMSLTSRVDDVDDEGVARIEWRIDTVDVGAMSGSIDGQPVPASDMQGVAAEMGLMLESLAGIGGSLLVDSQGTLLETSDSGGALAPPELLAELERLVTVEPLPSEPVGIGATWQTTTSSETAGIQTRLRTRSEVIELAPDRLVLDQVHSAAPARGRVADSPALRLMDLVVDGAGTTALALDRPAASGRQAITVQLRLRVDDGSRRGREVVHETITELTMSSAE